MTAPAQEWCRQEEYRAVATVHGGLSVDAYGREIDDPRNRQRTSQAWNRAEQQGRKGFP